MVDGVSVDTNDVPPYEFSLSGLGTGEYTLTARAEDDLALATISAPVVIKVGLFLEILPGQGNPIAFQFGSEVGKDYVVERAPAIDGFSPVVTNAGTGNPIQFTETDASAPQRSYRVREQ